MSFESLIAQQEFTCELLADRPLFGTKVDGLYEWVSFCEFNENLKTYRTLFNNVGVEKGDRVAIISDNSTSWALSAYATYGLNAIFVPMYTNQRPQDWDYIIQDCEPKLILVQNEKIYKNIKRRPLT